MPLLTFHFLNFLTMRKRIKKFQFDVTSQTSVVVRAESLNDAIDTFKVVYGDFLFNNVTCIWEV